MSGTHKGKFTPELRKAFLRALERTGSWTASASAVDLAQTTIHYHRNKDPEFELECKKALGRLDRQLMAQVKKLAVKGIITPIFDKNGKQVGEKRTFSERILLAWIKKQESGTWADRVAVKHEGSVEHKHSGRVEIEKLPAESQNRLRAFIESIPDEEPSAN